MSMALRLIEPPALMQSMVSAFMTSIASHAIRLREAASHCLQMAVALPARSS